MNITIVSHTPDPVKVCAVAARTCTTKLNADELFGLRFDSLSDVELVRKVIGMGHESILEHVSFTFHIEDVSRALSHQLVRFRIASFSQQSQRYVKAPFGYVTPPSICGHEEMCRDFNWLMIQCQRTYEKMVSEGIPAEDARFVLPNATSTKLVMTTNARELHHMFELRCCTHAQWEIRQMFEKILHLVKPIAPVIFENAGPTCVRHGICYEGNRSCGRLDREV